MREKTSLLRGNEGATAVEGALIISLLIFLVFGILEFGMALWAWNTMGLAVQDAGRYAMIHNASATVQADAINLMQTSLATAPGTISTTCTTPTADQICLSASTTTSGTPLLMTLTAAYGFDVIGLVGPFTLSSQATFPLD